MVVMEIDADLQQTMRQVEADSSRPACGSSNEARYRARRIYANTVLPCRRESRNDGILRATPCGRLPGSNGCRAMQGSIALPPTYPKAERGSQSALPNCPMYSYCTSSRAESGA